MGHLKHGIASFFLVYIFIGALGLMMFLLSIVWPSAYAKVDEYFFGGDEELEDEA